jgi:ATP-binding protein involved in chromosome partitioning
MKVGLLDLDFQGASCHTILGCRPDFPEEDRGLLAHEPVPGLRFATIASFIGERPAAMRGAALAEALREMLSVTRWGPLAVLVVDLPPGIHDIILELARVAPSSRHLVVATGSRLSVDVAARLLQYLHDAGTPAVGLLENMSRDRGAGTSGPLTTAVDLAARAGVAYLGAIPADPALEAAIGDPQALLASRFARSLAPIIERIPIAATGTSGSLTSPLRSVGAST